MHTANEQWNETIYKVFNHYDYEVAPRDQQVREVTRGSYKVNMNTPIVTNNSRKLNYKFMFGEAAWILSGRNDVDTISSYMKSYARFSDDGETLNGAYGPKIMEQISWGAQQLADDADTRRCYINIWRERPGVSLDIPCTVGMQFLIRDGKLNLFVTMRSQDVVLGMPYDIFSFSMVGKAMQLLLYKRHNIMVELGDLHVTANSLHIYEEHFHDVGKWLTCKQDRFGVVNSFNAALSNALDIKELIAALQDLTKEW